MKGPLVKILDFPNAKAPSKGKIKILPTLPFKIFERFFRKECDMSGVFVRLNRGVIGNIDDHLRTGLADPVNFLEKGDQVLDMLEQVAAEQFVDGIVLERKARLCIANNIDAVGANSVHPDVTGAFDTASPQIDLNKAYFSGCR